MYEFEEFIRSVDEADNLHEATATFTYGRPSKGHSWHATTWAQMVRNIAEHIRKHAPDDTDLSWLDD